MNIVQHIRSHFRDFITKKYRDAIFSSCAKHNNVIQDTNGIQSISKCQMFVLWYKSNYKTIDMTEEGCDVKNV